MWWKEHNYESSNLSSIALSSKKHTLNSCCGPGLVLRVGRVVVMKTDGPCSSWHMLIDACLLGPLTSYMMLGLSVGLSELQLSVKRVK